MHTRDFMATFVKLLAINFPWRILTQALFIRSHRSNATTYSVNRTPAQLSTSQHARHIPHLQTRHRRFRWFFICLPSHLYSISSFNPIKCLTLICVSPFIIVAPEVSPIPFTFTLQPFQFFQCLSKQHTATVLINSYIFRAGAARLSTVDPGSSMIQYWANQGRQNIDVHWCSNSAARKMEIFLLF